MSKPTLKAELKSNAEGGRYAISIENGPEAEMTYRQVDDTTIAIDHTYVPDEYRGQGIAKILFDQAIADAKADGKKIIPVCSYVAAQFRRHPELTELLATAHMLGGAHT